MLGGAEKGISLSDCTDNTFVYLWRVPLSLDLTIGDANVHDLQKAVAHMERHLIQAAFE